MPTRASRRGARRGGLGGFVEQAVDLFDEAVELLLGVTGVHVRDAPGPVDHHEERQQLRDVLSRGRVILVAPFAGNTAIDQRVRSIA